MPARTVPGFRHAGQVFTPPSPLLQERYPDGIYVDLHGFPDWTSVAKAIVEFENPPPGLTIDEVRVTDVVIANEIMARTGDERWQRPQTGEAVCTPAGLTWAHVAGSRALALVPMDIYHSFRHMGGVSTLATNRDVRGLRFDDASGYVPIAPDRQVAADAMAKLETHLGYEFPQSYREFFTETNGATPAAPGIYPDFGFVVDQRLFGLARTDQFEDIAYVNHWLGDRLTDDYLAVGNVQGGMLILKVRGANAGAILFWDDDDWRDDDRYEAEVICRDLLHHCGATFEEFWRSLHPVPPSLISVVRDAVEGDHARLVIN